MKIISFCWFFCFSPTSPNKQREISLFSLYYHPLPTKKTLQVSAPSLLSWDNQFFPHMLRIMDAPSFLLFCAGFFPVPLHIAWSTASKSGMTLESGPHQPWGDQSKSNAFQVAFLFVPLQISCVFLLEHHTHPQQSVLCIPTPNISVSYAYAQSTASQRHIHILIFRLLSPPALRIIPSASLTNVTRGTADHFPDSPRPAWKNPVPSVSPPNSQTSSVNHFCM